MFSVQGLPILSTVPRSGTWFLRYAISFLCHLDRGGRIDDRLTGKVVGNPEGPAFDFQRFRGGPLFRVRGTLPVDHLFIGHTVCPGFAALAGEVDWWAQTPFHVPGYDYLHEGMNYQYTPVDLAPYDYTPVRVPALERSAGKGRGQRMVLVYRNPLDQAASYFRYCQNHRDPAYSSINGRPLTGVPFRDYLFGSALPSYAKQFISFQTLAARHPGLVRLVAYEQLVDKPVDVLAGVLDHLSGAPRDRPMLSDAVWLARGEHMKALEKELGRSLDGTRNGHGSHIWHGARGGSDLGIDDTTRSESIALLQRMGLDTDLFEWPLAKQAATAA
jgi:hypothetical protein